MTPRVKKMYKMAITDEEFLEAVDKYEEERDWKEKAISDEVGRHFLGMCYWGWLVGKNLTERLNELKK